MNKTRYLFVATLLLGVVSASAWAARPSGSAELVASGTKLLEQGKLAPAQKAYEAAIKADPRSVDAHMKLAGVQIAQNNFTAAIMTYKETIGLDPTNAKAFIGLGIAYLHGGDKELTRAALAEALRLEPQRKSQLAPILAMLDEAEKAPK